VQVGVVPNSPPAADAGDDQTRDEGSTVILNGLGSADPDGDGLMFEWHQLSGPAVNLDDPHSATPTFALGPVQDGGDTLVFELTVTDTDEVRPLSDTDQVIINVLNINDPPRCELAGPDPESLWPPNHKLREVHIDGVSDPDRVYNQVHINVTGVTSDEPVVHHGDRTSPDAVINADSNLVLLRAERDGRGNGRVYQVHFMADDGFENCQGSITVAVPHSRAKKSLQDRRDDRRRDRADQHRHPLLAYLRERLQQQAQAVDDGQQYDATRSVPLAEDDADDSEKHEDRFEGRNRSQHGSARSHGRGRDGHEDRERADDRAPHHNGDSHRHDGNKAGRHGEHAAPGAGERDARHDAGHSDGRGRKIHGR
jgi:hypothetical protein